MQMGFPTICEWSLVLGMLKKNKRLPKFFNQEASQKAPEGASGMLPLNLPPSLAVSCKIKDARF